ncbi:MAG: hypothetical protein PHQ95_00615 [Candidatus Gracilibacteria bacterium]|nr:hypothetical protein [Candidatus Gracilibacteria bacterium]
MTEPIKGAHSYKITFDNLNTEKEAIAFLLEQDKRFRSPSKESRRLIMEAMGIEKRFSKAFDLVLVPDVYSGLSEIEIGDISEIVLIELKTTKKKLPNNPNGFFFGATENEFNLARFLGERFKFCFISLHPETLGFHLLTLSEMESLISGKRIQYQINLKTK